MRWPLLAFLVIVSLEISLLMFTSASCWSTTAAAASDSRLSTGQLADRPWNAVEVEAVIRIRPLNGRRKRCTMASPASSTTQRDGADRLPYLLYELNTAKRKLVLNLTRWSGADSLLTAGAIAQHLDRENFTWTRRFDTHAARYCLYSGSVLPDKGVALVNLCRGVRGTLMLNDGTYFLEPLGPNVSTDGQAHVLYKSAPTTFHDDVTVDAERPRDRPCQMRKKKWRRKKRQQWPSSASSSKTRSKRSYSRDYYIELLVVTDTRMRQYHGHNLENYVLTLLSIVATVFRHPSLEASLNIHLAKLLIVDYEHAGPRINGNAQQTLREFCRWQQSINDPDDDSVNHHDVAVLLTRHDICRVPGKCDTLGLAELGTMCDQFRSCAIIEDNGLSAAFTIAHELGHILNVPHDDEKKCAQFMGLNKENYHIMAPTLEFNTHPWSWSPCSTAMLSRFLESGQAQCMLDKPLEDKGDGGLAANPAPGLVFDGNQQCQFVFGPTSSLCPYMPTCKRLWCTTPYGQGYPSGCRTQHMPWADGTPCGSNRWCYRGDCVGIAPAHMLAVDGAWAEWNGWSECSRTCGGGVKRSNRECDNPRPSNGGKYCVGERVRHRSCNTKDCPMDSVDFRDLQCAEFNGKSVGIYGVSSDVRWVPKYSGVNAANRCKLYCRVAGTAAFYLLKDKVIDGTPCARYTDDICVDGLCRKAGCDNRLGSNLKRDDCGICGGDGASCTNVSGAYNEIHNYGYNFVTKIPKGASNINIVQVAWNGDNEDDNYLALQNSNGEFILNGHFQVSVYSHVIGVLGSVIQYSGSESPVERLNSTRPIMEDLLLHVLSVGGLNIPDVRYNYSIPMDVNYITNSIDYGWKALDDEWEPCDRVCHGSQSAKIACASLEDDQLVDERYCQHLKRPDRTSRVCNFHCHTKWESEPLSDCSVVCGHGEQAMRVVCVQVLSEHEKRPVDESQCSDQAKPAQRTPCYKDCVGQHWVYGAWQQCSVSCGGGVQTRQASCVDSKNNVIDVQFCENVIDDIAQRACNEQPCPAWSYGDWSQCSASCDGGVQKRMSICADAEGRQVDAAHCASSDRLDERKCNEHMCTLWNYGPWSGCSRTCGQGAASRLAWCEDSKGNKVADHLCSAGDKVVSKVCHHLSACPRWKLGEWSSCSRTCLDGWKTRRVQCVDGDDQELDSKYCATDVEQPPPPTHQPCNMGPCPFWRKHDWGPCSSTCGSGVQRRLVDCVHGDQVVGAGEHCGGDLAKPDESRVCDLVACPEWELGPWEPCSVTCGHGFQKRAVRCFYQDSRMPAEPGACDETDKPAAKRQCVRPPCASMIYSAVSGPLSLIAGRHRLPSLRSPMVHTSIVAKPPDTDPPTKWETGPWTECSNSCGSGQRTRLVICRDVYGRVLPEAYCSHVSPPYSFELCTASCGQWRTGPWPQCSATCGGEHVTTRREVACVSSASNERLANGQCDPASMPKAEKTCDLPPCQVDNRLYYSPHHGQSTSFAWRTGDWSSCSGTCGTGTQERLVQCVQEGTNGAVAHEYCSPELEPPSSQHCPLDHRCSPGSVRWQSDQWSHCSASCGRGTSTRRVRCVDSQSEQAVDDSLCPEAERPTEAQRCRMPACPRWRVHRWSSCSATCGDGVRTRMVVCLSGHQEVRPDDHCQLVSKPANASKCTASERCAKYRWATSQWSQCTKHCGEQRQVRETYCVSEMDRRVPPALCDASAKPTAVRSCLSEQCPYMWVPGPWSTCSKSCGRGEQYRVLRCLQKGRGDEQHGSEAAAGMCSALPEPVTRRHCSVTKCDDDYDVFWQPDSWTPCSVTCGWGYQERRMRCVNRQGVRMIKDMCQPDKLRKRRRCFVADCGSVLEERSAGRHHVLTPHWPSSCQQVKVKIGAVDDGDYPIWIGGSMVRLYCHGMRSAHPKEYLTLHQNGSNFAEFYKKRLINTLTCPHDGFRNDSCLCTEEKYPTHGLTTFHRIAVDPRTLQVDVYDGRFATVLQGSFIPFATAGDCYSAVKCAQGRFSVNLIGTGFRVSRLTHWMEQGHTTSKEIRRNHGGQMVDGRCGGFCGKCLPDRVRGLLLEVET